MNRTLLSLLCMMACKIVEEYLPPSLPIKVKAFPAHYSSLYCLPACPKDALRMRRQLLQIITPLYNIMQRFLLS